MKKYKVIANPAAGGGAGARAIPRIEQWLAKYGLDFDIVHTERSWHGAELAREAAIARWDVIAAAGGDGTSNGETPCVDGNRLEIELLLRQVEVVYQAPGDIR
jgi:diacylglycerol kinase family enzyme